MVKATAESTTEFLPLPTTTPQPKTSTALRTATQVLEALQTRYNGPIDQIDGFSYIPWHVSNKLANEIFGFLGWSSSVISCEYTECELDVKDRQTGQFERREFRGFKSIVRIEVQTWDEGLGMVIRTHHDGVGYGPIQAQGAKNPMDGATKSAKSDGISTAIKHYGDAFGLFLYEKENKQATGSVPAATTGTTSTYQGGGKSLSEKQLNVLVTKLSITPQQAAAFPFDQAKAAIDALFSNTPPWDVCKSLGIEYVKKGDRLPIPA